MESKYKTQADHIRKTYVRFPLDLRPDLLEAFKEACTINGTKPTTEIKKFIKSYIDSTQG